MAIKISTKIKDLFSVDKRGHLAVFVLFLSLLVAVISFHFRSSTVNLVHYWYSGNSYLSTLPEPDSSPMYILLYVPSSIQIRIENKELKKEIISILRESTFVEPYSKRPIRYIHYQGVDGYIYKLGLGTFINYGGGKYQNKKFLDFISSLVSLIAANYNYSDEDVVVIGDGGAHTFNGNIDFSIDIIQNSEAIDESDKV